MRLFPFCVGLVVIALPHIFGTGFDAAGINDTLSGLALVGLSMFSGRAWQLRLAQALLGVWIAMGPFVLDAAAYVLYAGIVMGKLVALAALVPPQMFEESGRDAGSH